jgi:hypothetical protein
MQQHQCKEDETETEVRIPEQRVQAVALRQQCRNSDTAKYHKRVGGSPKHANAKQWHDDHKAVQREV